MQKMKVIFINISINVITGNEAALIPFCLELECNNIYKPWYYW